MQTPGILNNDRSYCILASILGLCHVTGDLCVWVPTELRIPEE